LQRETIIDRLAGALDALRVRTCREMVPLWVEGTRRERELLGEVFEDLGFAVSKRYRALSAGARSRYRYLATWRHAVLCEEVAERVVDPDYADAVRVVYFTPYPANKPPYAWSSRASEAPGVERFPSATTLKHYAKEGAWHTGEVLRQICRELSRDPSFYAEVRAAFVRSGCRDTVREVLKLEDHPRWEDL
jgi:hypothetical protein